MIPRAQYTPTPGVTGPPNVPVKCGIDGSYELQTSPRVVARLLVRLCRKAETPVARAAEKHERAMRRVFLRAVREAQDAIPMGELEDALRMPGWGAASYVLQPVVDMMLEPTKLPAPLEPYMRVAAGKETVASVLSGALESGANVGARKLGMSFDSANPEAIAWAEREAATLVKYVTEDVRDAIRLFVTRGIEEGIPPRRLAALIREGIGLTPKDATAVMNARARWLKEGLNAAQVDKKARAYSEKLLRRRAETIARTETMRAANEGQRQLWQQAQEAGLLPKGGLMKVWITADPCEICAPLEGETVPMNESFSVGTDPPLHPNCRCTIGLVG